MRKVVARATGFMILSVLLVAGVGLRVCSLRAEPVVVTNAPMPAESKGKSNTEGAQTPQGAIYPVQKAFAQGLKALGSRVDLYDTHGWIRLRRAKTNGWTMTLHKYPGQAVEVIRITITDNGEVELLEIPQGTVQASRHPKVPMPAVVFLKAIHSLKGNVDFSEPDGQIVFRRTGENEWLIMLMAYRGIQFQGLLLFISNDLRVRKTSAP